ncbi:MAG: ABC transporter permease [Candidatus Zixiibacteriota bacterium]|nr:MAG: ABC transporter permease [candidate division Zixibacteria bacterium]
MITNFLKIAFRQAWRHKEYTFINIIGLAISFACCMLISLWILDELNYDKGYADVEHIQSILVNDERFCPNALAPFLQNQVPEIEFAAMVSGKREILVSSGPLQSYEEYTVVDPSIIDVFSLPFISGDSRNALMEPNSVIITEDMASKFFPDRDAVGRTLSFDNQRDLVVTGVVTNMPHNSSLQFDILVSVDYEKRSSPELADFYDAWKAWGSKTYVKVWPGTTPEILTDRISDLIQDRYDEDESVRLSAIYISDLHLRYSDAKIGIAIFSGIAMAILLMACINFINLSTARYLMRSKETGIRKLIGARRGSLILRYLSESFLLTITGSFFALIITELALPYFNSMLQLNLSLGLFNDWSIISAIIVIIIITALAAGFYPALVLSRFNPVQALKDNVGSTHKRFILRRALVVIQFSVTLFLILGTAIIYTQINYIKVRDVGYKKDHVINIPLREDSRDQFAVLKNEFLKNPEILAVTGCAKSLPYWSMFTLATWDGLQSADGERVSMNFAGYDFTQTYGIRLVEGRDFSREQPTDIKYGCIINDELAALMNKKPILGAGIEIWGENRRVIGVTENFNFQSLSEAVEPLAIMMVSEDNFIFTKMRGLSARISPRNIKATIGYLRETWETILPNHPFEYSFLDEQFDAEYKSMEKIMNLAGSFGVLAIIVACLGLFGLASFTAEQRTKEIGIRKVLGASILNIVNMISKEFVILVFVSNMVAWPLAWLAMNRWLEEFAYHMNINIGLFFIVGSCVMVVALLSVSYQAVRAACANPVVALKHE